MLLSVVDSCEVGVLRHVLVHCVLVSHWNTTIASRLIAIDISQVRFLVALNVCWLSIKFLVCCRHGLRLLLRWLLRLQVVIGGELTRVACTWLLKRVAILKKDSDLFTKWCLDSLLIFWVATKARFASRIDFVNVDHLVALYRRLRRIKCHLFYFLIIMRAASLIGILLSQIASQPACSINQSLIIQDKIILVYLHLERWLFLKSDWTTLW